jgi:threonine dehydrogenase-like Zn-dependent dehydrogenase
MSETGVRLRIQSDRTVGWETFPVPDPGPDQVLVRVGMTHVSAGSEINFFRQNPADGPLRTTPIGYQGVGTIQAMGANVTGFAPGERVLVGANHGSHWLIDLSDTKPDAGLRQCLERIPENVSDAAAGFAILGDVSLHGVRRARLQIDESVAVIGCGVVGQQTIQLARVSGAYPVIAIDLFDSRLELAKASGATHGVNPSKTDPVAAVKEITGGGAQTVFHCAPVAQVLQTAMEMAGERAKIVLTASAPGIAEIGLQVELMRRELSIIGVYEVGIDHPHGYWPWTRTRNRKACLRMLASGDMRHDHLVSHVVPFTEAESMYRMMERGGDDWLGVAFTWDDLSPALGHA